MKSIRALFAVIMLLMCGCTKREQASLDLSASYFHEFHVQDDKVYLRCDLAVKNNCDEEIKLYISADFSEDRDLGLLKQSILYACDDQDDRKIFSLEANEAEIFESIFVGDFSGTHQKADRELPENITIELIK